MDIDDRHLFIKDEVLPMVKELVLKFKQEHAWEKPAKAQIRLD